MTISVSPERSTLSLPGARLRPDQPTLRAGPDGVSSRPAPSRETPAVSVPRGPAPDVSALRTATAGLDRASSILDAGQAAAAAVSDLLAGLRDGRGDPAQVLADIRDAVGAGGFDGVNLLKGDGPGAGLKVGAGVDGGEDLLVRAHDFRPGGPIVAIDPKADARAVAAQADASLVKTEAARAALGEDGKRLEAHRAFVGLLSNALAGAGESLDVDGARLAALSVKQTIGGTSLTLSNGGAQGVLSLFR